jgi:hypothetical protein
MTWETSEDAVVNLFNYLEEKSGLLATLIFVPGKHETSEDAVGNLFN